MSTSSCDLWTCDLMANLAEGLPHTFFQQKGKVLSLSSYPTDGRAKKHFFSTLENKNQNYSLCWRLYAKISILYQ